MNQNRKFLTIIIVVILSITTILYFVRKEHKKNITKIIDLDTSKDSVISILTKDNIRYELTIVAQDSVINLYYSKTQYLQLLLNKKEKQLRYVSKEDERIKNEIKKRDKKIDSLILFIDGFERVYVPE